MKRGHNMENFNVDKIDTDDKESAISYLIDAYGDMLKRLAFSYVKDINLTEDVIQDVFISCYNNLDSFNGESSYKTWLYRITINRSKDVRKTKFFRDVQPFNSLKKHIRTNEISAELLLIDKEKSNRVTELVLTLPAKYREIIYLYYYEDLKIQEIHKLTTISQDTIKTRLRRGRIMLKRKLEKEHLDI